MKKNEIELILACIVGDGYIKKTRKKYYSLHFTHSPKQYDYLEWKVEHINNLEIIQKSTYKNKMTISNMITKHSNGKTFMQKRATLYRSRLFSDIYKNFYNEGKKNIKKMLQYLENDLALAIWFMDDGSLLRYKRKHKNGDVYYIKPSCVLCTHNFSYEENVLIQEWFYKKFNIQAKIQKQRNYYMLFFNAKETYKIWLHIKKYVNEIDSMKQKFDLCINFYSI